MPDLGVYERRQLFKNDISNCQLQRRNAITVDWYGSSPRSSFGSCDNISDSFIDSRDERLYKYKFIF